MSKRISYEHSVDFIEPVWAKDGPDTYANGLDIKTIEKTMQTRSDAGWCLVSVTRDLPGRFQLFWRRRRVGDG